MEDLAPFIVIWLVSGLITAMVWSSKGGSSGAAFLMGVLFGPLAVLIAFFTSPGSSAGGGGGGRSGGLPRRSCPHCREPMAVDARLCGNCQRESEPIPISAGAPPHQIRGEVVYAELSRHGTQSPAQLVRGTGMAAREIDQALQGLVRSGVVTANSDGTFAAS